MIGHQRSHFQALLGLSAIILAGIGQRAVAQETKAKAEAPSGGRLGTLAKCQAAAKQVWGSELKQIPSTVVDKGVLRFIPYSSFRSARFEINVYGDPEQPCCVEAGIHNDQLATSTAKQTCIELIHSLLVSPEDRNVLKSLNLQEAMEKRAGLTFEITPATAEDAYGGWWVSVYDETACHKSRASPEELKELTIAKETILQQSTAKRPADKDKAIDDPDGWNADDLKLARPTAVKKKVEPVKKAPVTTSVPALPTSGSVYVRGYVRKDGTYVRPHTRSRPRR